MYRSLSKSKDGDNKTKIEPAHNPVTMNSQMTDIDGVTAVKDNSQLSQMDDPVSKFP